MKKHLPLLAGLLALLFVAATLRLPKSPTAFDTEGFGRLPVLLSGRLKPLDTVARTSLLQIQNRQRAKTPDGRTLTPSEWLLDVVFKPDVADSYKCFRIDNNEALALFHLTLDDGDGKVRFSFNQLKAGLDDFERQTERASQIESGVRTPFEREVLKLRERLTAYIALRFALQLPQSPDFAAEIEHFAAILRPALAATQARMAGQPHDEAAVKELAGFFNKFDLLRTRAQLLTIPPRTGTSDANAWKTLGDALRDSLATGEVPAAVRTYAALGHAWRAGDATAFNQQVALLHQTVVPSTDARLAKTAVEFRFNHAEPFYIASILYVLALLLAFVSWLVLPDLLGRSALSIGFVAWLLTTAGIIARMFIESRPPVTNLYSSALFVGWVGAGLALAFERFYRNSVGNVVAGVIGFLTLLIGHYLSFGGDTMEMMRAVLDSNFWLATHVVTITMGYGATFVAGVLAVVFITRGALTRSLDQNTAEALSRMVYGAVCFATLFSLVGTILGGIWADQSWGRFWGWDPKENGALIIVLWNALILHARWAKLVRDRGLMNLAVFGNCITAASWFGVNMLGVGLHSYGFMDSAFFWLCVFWLSQLAVIGLGLLPLPLWRSFAVVRREQNS